MSTTASPPKQTRHNLVYLDGLRGLSALYVAFCHAKLYCGHNVSTQQLSKVLRPFSFVFSFADFAVCVFIVLSGFCLTIPVALDPQKQLKGGFKSYIGRRAKRILPPYYASVILFVLLIFALPILQTPQDTAWDSKIPVTAGAITTHLLLIHNLFYQYAYKIDGPLWTVATEWQIYFVFPLLILFWKRIGLVTTVLAAVVSAIVISLFWKPGVVMHLWFLGLFALGMLGSVITFSEEERWVLFRNRTNWALWSLILGMVGIGALLLNKLHPVSVQLTETLAGLAVSCLLIRYSLVEINGLKKPLFLRFLNTRSALWIGTFSYSIYLFHSPIIGLMNLMSLRYPMSDNLRWIGLELIAVPVSVAFSYLLYLLVERRFIASHKVRKQINPAAETVAA